MEWREIQRVMVVFAHPDDAEFGSAGTAARMAQEGKEVVYVVTTDGSKGSADPEMTPEKLTALRKREQLDAAGVAGVKHVEFLDFEDGMLQPTLELRRAISAAIRRFKPDVVIAQSPVRDLASATFVQHPDHLATGEATMGAVYPCARDRMTFPELLAQGLEPHAVKELWITGTEGADHFVDIGSTVPTKINALRAHHSQVSHRNVAEFVPDRARQLGERGGLEFAEAFKRITLP